MKQKLIPLKDCTADWEDPISEAQGRRLCREGRIPGAEQDRYGYWNVPKGSKDPRHPVGRPASTERK